MNNPSSCIVAFFCVVLFVVLIASCVGTIYLFQSEEVGGAISDISRSVSVAIGQGGKAILYVGIGLMGALLMVGLGFAIRNAGPGIEAAGEGIAKAAIGQAVAGAIEEGRADCLPPVWRIFERPRLREPVPRYESEYKLLEE